MTPEVSKLIREYLIILNPQNKDATLKVLDSKVAATELFLIEVNLAGIINKYIIVSFAKSINVQLTGADCQTIDDSENWIYKNLWYGEMGEV